VENKSKKEAIIAKVRVNDRNLLSKMQISSSWERWLFGRWLMAVPGSAVHIALITLLSESLTGHLPTKTANRERSRMGIKKGAPNQGPFYKPPSSST
jgi:hypothetical protein